MSTIRLVIEKFCSDESASPGYVVPDNYAETSKYTVSNNNGVPEDIAKENFEIEIESWLFAIKQSKAKFDSQTIHALLREMSGSFAEAIKGLVSFDLVQLADKIYLSTGKVVCQKEIVFYLLANLPNPKPLNDLQFKTFEDIIAKAKSQYPEVVSKFEARISSARDVK